MLATTVAPASAGIPTRHAAVKPTDAKPFVYEKSEPFGPVERRVETTETYVASKITYWSQGKRVPAYFTTPVKREGKVPCIVILSGFGGSKEEARGLWEPMAQFGFATFALDARLHGERGTRNQLEKAARTAKGMRATLQGTAVDTLRALDYLATHKVCDPKRFGIFGQSMGAFVATMVAGTDKRVRATVLLSGGASWRTLFTKTKALEDAGVGVVATRRDPKKLDAAVKVLDPIDPKRWVGKISPRPVFMINGRSDSVVPPASAKALHAAAKEPKDIDWYKGDHAAEGLAFVRGVIAVFSWFFVKLKIG